MPAFSPELQMALDEGVKLKTLLTPITIKDVGSNSADHRASYVVTLQKMKVSATEIEGRAHELRGGDKTETQQRDYLLSDVEA